MLDEDFRVERICGPGVDPEFDQLISALGHIARQKPKPLIDTIMYWRKAKGEAATSAKAEMNQVGHQSRCDLEMLIVLRQKHPFLYSEIFLEETQSRHIYCTPAQVKQHRVFMIPTTQLLLLYTISQSRPSSDQLFPFTSFVGY